MCDCSKRKLTHGMGKGVVVKTVTVTPYTGGATADGKTIAAGPIEFTEVLDLCNGSGILREVVVSEAIASGSPQKMAMDVIILSAEGYSIATNTTTAFVLSTLTANDLCAWLQIASADYKERNSIAVARVQADGMTVFNRSVTDGKKQTVFVYLVAKEAKTFAAGTSLLVSLRVEQD